MAAKPPIIVVAGPTAAGKTAVAVEVARRLGTEIISADSMQVYRRLSIGTGKPTEAELGGTRYHLIDCVDPGVQYNAGDFLRDADDIVERLMGEGRVPIVCGGTGLYIRALLHGLFTEFERDAGLRAQLEEELAGRGLDAMYDELRRCDPRATHIMPGDAIRILRALEVIRATGRPITDLQSHSRAPRRHQFAFIVLTVARSALLERIDRRVQDMVSRGLVQEVERYLADGLPTGNPAFRALGYMEVAAHLKGATELEEALRRMKGRTRHYAKRQMTWFRAVAEATFIDATCSRTEYMADHVISIARRHGVRS